MPRILAQFPLCGGFVKPLVQPRALEQDPAPHTGVTERGRAGNPAFRGVEEVRRRNVEVGRRLSQRQYGRIRLGARDFIGCSERLSRHARRRRCGRGSLCLDLGRHTSIGIHQNPLYVSGLRPDVSPALSALSVSDLAAWSSVYRVPARGCEVATEGLGILGSLRKFRSEKRNGNCRKENLDCAGTIETAQPDHRRLARARRYLREH